MKRITFLIFFLTVLGFIRFSLPFFPSLYSPACFSKQDTWTVLSMFQKHCGKKFSHSHHRASMLSFLGYSAAIPWELKSRLTYTGNRESLKKKPPTCSPLPTIRDQLSFLLFFVLECFKNLNLSFPPTVLFMHPVFYALFVPAIFFIPIQILQMIFHAKKRYPCLTTSVKSWISLL